MTSGLLNLEEETEKSAVTKRWYQPFVCFLHLLEVISASITGGLRHFTKT